jgi:hypothetical protein
MTTTKKATLGITLAYTNEEGAAGAITPITVLCLFEGQSHGAIDVPDAETSATAHVVPFGSVAKATCVVVKNLTGQALECTENGVVVTKNIPIGGVYVYGGPNFPAAQPLVSLSLKTTAAQVDAGTIAYHVFGDPV